jgi:hypothetical protein
MIDNAVAMDQLEQILIGLPHLRCLSLDLFGERDRLDAHRWEMLTTGLHSFSFDFQLSNHIDLVDLRFFSTPYCTGEKRWYVARYDRGVFSGAPFIIARIRLPEEDRLISTAQVECPLSFTTVYCQIRPP